MKWNRCLLALMCLILVTSGIAQETQATQTFTRADTLRGSITEYRKGWDVLHYNLQVQVDIAQQTISGSNTITYYESLPVRKMQIDLQQPLLIDSIVNEAGFKVPFTNEGNVWLAQLKPEGAMIKFLPGTRSLQVYYHGKPRVAKRAPWDGGLVWKKDSTNNPFVATACQGQGASVWWPCKDHQSDEPDSGMIISITAPDTLSAISNGRLQRVTDAGNGYSTWTWQVHNPINNYDVTMNIGKYIHWNEVYDGEAGKLDLQFWALQQDSAKAVKQFAQVHPMLQCFEAWLGKYPFYEDGYKLVQTPFLGMEHQSAVAYGNRFLNGYLGFDRSKSGYGLKWDYIIIHESGHEWFGNSITTADIADMWVHEGFTTYTEVLYTECQSGKEAAYAYMKGLMGKLANDEPVTGKYGVNNEGSVDMYEKGAGMIHTIRNMLNNDEKFRQLLRNMQATFYHQIVTANQVEDFIMKGTGLKLKPVFEQYLRSTKIPVLEYMVNKRNRIIHYRFTNVVDKFEIPFSFSISEKNIRLNASAKWKKIKLSTAELKALNLPDLQSKYLITLKDISTKPTTANGKHS